MPFAVSLRTSLFSLVVLSLAPVALASVAVAWMLMARVDALASSEVELYAHTAAAHHEGVVDGVQHLLHAIAAAPLVREGQSAAECDALLAGIVARFPQYRALGVGDAEGRPVCATPGLADRTLRAAAEVAQARAGFNIVYLSGHGARPVPVALMAAGDASRRMNRVVVAVMESHWLHDAATHVGLPAGARIHLVDADGNVLSPESDLGSRAVVPPAPVADLDGTLTAVWPLGTAGLRVVVTMPREMAWWRFTEILGRAPIDMVMAVLAALATAGIGIHRLVLVKVDRLGAAARRIRVGELGVRSGMADEPGEFGRLARTFDTMAAAMDDRARNYHASLRAGEVRWRTLARVAPVAIFRTDAGGNCRYVNDRWTEITGQPVAAAMGAGHLDCLHPDDRAWVGAGLLDAMAAGRPIDLSYRCRRPDGATAWVLTRAVPEYGPSGHPVGYIGTMTDITGEKLAMDALHRSEARFRHALKHSRVSVFAQDRDLVYTWVYNCPLGERLLGLRDDDVLAAEESAVLTALKRAVLDSGQPRRQEVVVTLGGERRTMDLWLDPWREPDGAVMGIVGAAIDITEERALHDALTEAREAAEQANLAKSRFLASASHDLRQPFQAMRLFSSALAPYLSDPAAGRIAAKLDEAMTAGELLLKALLDISTLEAGTVTPRRAATSAAGLIDRLAREFQPQAEAHGLGFRARSADGLVWTDPVLLERMLRNLLHNAVRYTRRGGILLAARRRGDLLAFEVWDTGVGIADHEQDKVFEDFYQVGNLERDRSRGLGLGLSVVARTGRLLGHPVTLRSRPGLGSVFAVAVPLVDEPEQAAA